MKEIVPLIQRAQEGDPEAYGVIVSRFQDMAYGYAYAILNNFELAKDATQEAFIEAYQCLPNLREEMAFPAWFKRIVYKHCDRLTRGEHLSTVPLDAVGEMASPLLDPAEAAERRELARQVLEAIRELPIKQRMVTTLFYINGYSHQEIAEFLEVPAKTVKSRLHASRGRLRERILDMVEDEMKANALPDGFTKETVEQAVAKAKELNAGSRHDQAEELLKKVLEQVPEHPGALKELNRALMHGRVYGQGRWELLQELAAQGRTILKKVDDDYVHHELARTLLAIPAMPEAVSFLEEWIAQKGPNIEQLGMLDWAKGCVGDYEAAETLWRDILNISRGSEKDEVLFNIPFIASTLVDCFVEAGELPRAQWVAKQAWERCLDLWPTSPEVAAQLIHHRGFSADAGWMWIFNQAKLDLREAANILLERYREVPGLEGHGVSLAIRSWTDDPMDVTPEWLEWVQKVIEVRDFLLLERFRSSIARTFWARGDWRASNRLTNAVWELVKDVDKEEAKKYLPCWDWERINPMGAIEAGDWDAAEELIHRIIEERGLQHGGWLTVLLAATRGVQTPPDLMRSIKEKGVSSIDDYGIYGWYAVAREAAAAGDEEKALDALRKALSYWSNPPYALLKLCEKDSYLGSFRDNADYKRIVDEKRQRIGPVYGHLHYFPGW